MKNKCKEAWHLFWSLCDRYYDVILQDQLPRDWTLYIKALAEYNHHRATCDLCGYPLPEPTPRVRRRGIVLQRSRRSLP